MNKAPLFTVVTVTFNSAKWVRHTIESVLSSSFECFEYIIADDCSTDSTWSIIEDYKDARIRAWRNEKNLGEYPNRNKALRAATGKYILYIDGDDILYKNSLEEYSKLISAFPEAGAIWGVYPNCFDFIVYPYMFSPIELSKLNFLSTYPISAIGFADSLFKVEHLKEMGGLDERFVMGDVYLKLKFGCLYPVLIIPATKAYWRMHLNQASNRVRENYQSFLERNAIDTEILAASYLPLAGDDLKIAIDNLKNRTVKLLVSNTILKGRILDFFKLFKILKLQVKDLLVVRKKGNYSYKVNATSENPLMNNYNFS